MAEPDPDFERMQAARMKGSTVLTPKQEAIYKYIRSRILSGDPAPTVREIGEEFGLRSPNGVMGHLKAFVKKGYIVRDENLSRSIGLPGRSAIEVLRDIRKLMPKNPGDKSRTVKLSAELVAELVRLAE
ncbi:MAG: LexA family protein [Planctomycetota bacterium]|jgi:SOS-response transcriptional repressor LexA